MVLVCNLNTDEAEPSKSLGIPDSQPTLLVKLQAKERPCLKTPRQIESEEYHLRFTSYLRRHAPTRTHTYTYKITFLVLTCSKPLTGPLFPPSSHLYLPPSLLFLPLDWTQGLPCAVQALSYTSNLSAFVLLFIQDPNLSITWKALHMMALCPFVWSQTHCSCFLFTMCTVISPEADLSTHSSSPEALSL